MSEASSSYQTPLMVDNVNTELGNYSSNQADEGDEIKKVESYSEKCCGICKLCYFLICCSCSLCCGTLFAAGPWMLAFLEIIGVFLIYYVGVHPGYVQHSQDARQAIDNFVDHLMSFTDRVEDILAFAVVRGIVVSMAYGFGTGKRHHKPYLCMSYMCLFLSLIFIGLKATFFEWHLYGESARAKYVILMMVFNMGASLLHIPSARHVHIAARQRYVFGVPQGFGFPGEGGEGEDEAWLLTATNPEGIKSMMRFDNEEDFLPQQLSDLDSKFFTLHPSGLTIHYKECYPAQGVQNPLKAVVLVHGFAGGTFTWRKIMPQLAEKCSCRVIAMDLVGWGLSARPGVDECSQENYYETGSQARQVLQFCTQLGLKEVVFVSQGSGAVFVILATTLAFRLKMQSSINLAENSKTSKLRKLQQHLQDIITSWRIDERRILESHSCQTSSQTRIQILSVSKVTGLVLLHPLLESNPVARFTKPLSRTRFGRDILRPLLRVAVGQVINHRLWYDEKKISEELVQYVSQPLHVQGWDYALIQRCNQAPQQAIYGESEFLESASEALADIPTLIITGVADKIVTPQQATKLTRYFQQSRRVDISNCGHFSVEETPSVLLEFLVPFLTQRIVTDK